MSSVYGWLCVVTVLLSVGVAAGAGIYGWLTQSQRQAIADRERAVRDEWDALQRAHDLNEAFWRARVAMRSASDADPLEDHAVE